MWGAGGERTHQAEEGCFLKPDSDGPPSLSGSLYLPGVLADHRETLEPDGLFHAFSFARDMIKASVGFLLIPDVPEEQTD